MSELAKTPLTSWHASNGGRLVEFSGYSMPVQYEGVVAEHRAVRERCGLFDVSHMAELRVSGVAARSAVDSLVTNDVGKLPSGGVLYTALCNDNGTILDDLLVYCLAEDDYLIVANASNRSKVRDWLESRLPGGVRLSDESDDTALLALQGPNSPQVLKAWPRLKNELSTLDDLDYYRAVTVDGDGSPFLLSRTGYTGERGYELYVPASQARSIWEELLEAGEAAGIQACGLGARDTLRLEAGFSLYGHELDEESTPYECGIGWVVRLKKGDFVGRDALLQQKEGGVPRRTVGLVFGERNIARQDAKVLVDNSAVGIVTSGTFSPTRGQGIALARVQTDAAEAALEVDIRGRRAKAEIHQPPFVPNRTRD